jgi:hypothetical protein
MRANGDTMRPLIIALMAVLLVATANAQGMRGGGGKKSRGDNASAAPRKQVDDKDYKAAIDRLPDQKYDPWKNMR